MVAAGFYHTVLLTSDGKAVACGRNDHGQCNIPKLPRGLTYIQASAEGTHTVLLRSDGTVVAGGRNDYGQCNIPELDFKSGLCSKLKLEGELSYTQVATGHRHTVLLRSDGTVVACGSNEEGQCNIPALGHGLTYTRVAAGLFHSLMLRSDGTVAACGGKGFPCGQCNIPALEGFRGYVDISAGSHHTLLIRSDGTATGVGLNESGQCDIPALEDSVAYVQASGGSSHTLLLRSDGTVAACGKNNKGQCDIPVLEPGLTYTHVSASSDHALLLRSDGQQVETCGHKSTYMAEGCCNVPSLQSWAEWWGFQLPQMRYIPSLDGPRRVASLVLQVVHCSVNEAGDSLLFVNDEDGTALCEIEVDGKDRLADVRAQVRSKICLTGAILDVIFPGGELLSHTLLRNASATVASVFEPRNQITVERCDSAVVLNSMLRSVWLPYMNALRLRLSSPPGVGSWVAVVD